MAHFEGKQNAYRVMVWQAAGALERRRCRSECNNKMHLKKWQCILDSAYSKNSPNDGCYEH